MVGLAFGAVGSFCRRSFACASVRFRPSGSIFPCADVVLSSCGDFFGSHAPRAFPFFSLPPSSPSLPSEGREEGGDLRMPLCCFLWVFLSSRSTFVQREGWRSLWSLVQWPCGVVVACLLHTQEIPGSIPGWGSYLRQVSLH